MPDPFRWLEEETADVLAWQEAEDRAAREHLHAYTAWPTALSTARRFSVPALAYQPAELHGGRWFRERVPDGAHNPVLEVAETAAGPGRVLVDLTDREARSALYWSPSPDGRRLAFAVADPPLFRVVDVDSGEVLLPGLPCGGVHRVTWLPDSTRLFCVVDELTRSTGYLVRLSAEPEVERQALPANPVTRRVTVSPDGRWALAHDSDRPNFLRDLEDGSGWVPFLRDATGRFRGTVVGGDFVAVTDQGAANGRVVAIPLDGSAWRELVPAGDCVLFSVADIGTELVLAEYADGAGRLRRITPDGTVLGEIPLPDKGMVWPGPGRDEGMVTATRDGCTFSFSSLTRSPATYHYSAGDTAPRQVTPQQVSVDGAVMRTGVADGIPYKVVCEAGHPGPRPLIIGAYGALNIAWLPAYLFALPAAWVHLGGVYVHAHLRGGGEYGTAWWQGARRHTKQNTFDDLYTVAEHLVDQGWTTPEQLGVFGASLGALPAAVAVTQRPGLFRACVAMMPVLDLLRCRKDPATMADIVATDLGDPRDPSDAAVLRAYSPYHQVRDGTAYPAVLLDCGAAGRSCPAWHGRKMAARLRRATSSRHPVLLRVRPAGHITETTPEDLLWRDAEQLAFFAEELGLPLPKDAAGAVG
ncbi:prolyl oligopeptidase [Saccharothrix tamanrassetensis]|uniref:prolyl oligopeptidase n=1 Tax=Saccharothrix tamanrassetensis TaxID=1051531 RepID=A0A841CUA3_9PSEU|nr:prolyl oligopeptidase family serine peptidase [Saccharothrix tamanrassetensis]MBB5959607.1 prolyl oligopeptidase [Saccharothrix tamanrassetensis]